MAHDVFISYAVEDVRVAEQVCGALEEQSVKCWMAPRDVPYGVRYEQAILDAIEESRFLVLIFSSHANASQHVEREIRKAFEDCSKTQVFPFRIENVPYNKVLYYYLGGAQWVDASTPHLEAHLSRLVGHIRASLPVTNETATPPGDTGTPESPAEQPPDALDDFVDPDTGEQPARKAGDGLRLTWAVLLIPPVLISVIILFQAISANEPPADPTDGNENLSLSHSPMPQPSPEDEPAGQPSASPTPSAVKVERPASPAVTPGPDNSPGPRVTSPRRAANTNASAAPASKPRKVDEIREAPPDDEGEEGEEEPTPTPTPKRNRRLDINANVDPPPMPREEKPPGPTTPRLF